MFDINLNQLAKDELTAQLSNEIQKMNEEINEISLDFQVSKIKGQLIEECAAFNTDSSMDFYSMKNEADACYNEELKKMTDLLPQKQEKLKMLKCMLDKLNSKN